MIDSTRDLTEKLLKKNFAYWSSKWPGPTSKVEPWDPVFVIPATHTFGAWRKWGDAGDSIEFPYEEILLRDKRLISDYHRQKALPKKSKKLRRRMSKARRVKLDQFVFAYHGIHDPYYARTEEIDVAAFGVFIKTDLERFPKCNATRRDLDSEEAESPPDREFLFPYDARLLAKHQVTRDHRGDFWHYWGSEDFFKNQTYVRKHWNWKAEFHFHEDVTIESLDAVLWPYENWGRQRRLIGGNHLKTDFERIHSNCKVIPYHWSNLAPTLSLIKASFMVTRYLLAKGMYPENADDAINYFKS